jgi:hypothetical protein
MECRILDHFRWNEPLPAELFKLEVPKGFTLGSLGIKKSG